MFGEKQDKNPIFVSCKMGIMSKRGTDFLIKHGYENTKNVEGGINGYGKTFDPNIAKL
jgi:rhodanese-related sulfurtransferase